MRHWIGFIRGISSAVALSTLTTSLAADIKYQSRGDRWEGVLAENVSGFEVELLSATVDYVEASAPLAQSFHLRFFLEKSFQTPHVTVRELTNRKYYWLDQVQPRSSWKPGSINEYTWSTIPVIRPLGDLGIDHLGVVVRLDDPKPKPVELVAPAVLFQSNAAESITGYRFVFKLEKGGNDLEAKVFAEPDVQHSIWRAALGKKLAGTPINAVWPVDAKAPRGWYRLVLSGISLRSGQKISQVVRFFHEPQPR